MTNQLNPLALAAAQTLVESMPARVVYLKTPLATDVGPEDFVAVAPSSSIQDLAPDWSGPFVCAINGAYISRRDWWQPVQPGELVIFQAVPLGGQGGSNPLRIILMIAVMVVANVYGAQLGAAIMGSSSATATALGGALINIVGTLAINALVPMSAAASTGTSSSPSPTYSVALQGNQARAEQVAPAGYGKMKSFPDFATQPYIEYLDNEQYYYAMFKIGSTGGRGFYEVLGRYIDDTPTSEFSDVTVRVLGQTKDGYIDVNTDGLVNTSMITAAEVSGQELNVEGSPVGAFSVCKAGSQVSQIHIDIVCQRGIGTAEDDGSISGRDVDFAINIRPINDFDQATGYWDALAYEQISASTATPVQRSYTYNVPPGRYQVQAVRASEYSDNSRHLNDLTWAGLRATITQPGINDPQATYMAIKIRASKQLSGTSQRKIAVLWQRHLPVWDGSAWIVQATRNPAWALYDICSNPGYGRKLPDARIDLEALFSLAPLWDERQDRCDYIFDSKVTVHDALKLVARTGRATPVQRRGRWTFVRDEQQDLPVAIVTPRHMKTDSFNVSYTLASEDQADAYRVKYRDGRYWEERYVTAQAVNGQIYVYGQNEVRPGPVPEPTKIVDLDLPGVLGLHHAKREAAYMLGVSQFRRKRVSWTLDKFGLLPAYGALMGVVHDVLDIGQHADIYAYNPATRTITASQPMTWPAEGVTCVIRMSTKTGVATAKLPVVRGARDNELVLIDPPPFVPVDASDAKRTPTKFAFGTVSDGECAYVLAQSLKPAQGGNVAMSGPVEDNRVHLADNAWLPVDGVEQDPLSDGTASEGGLGESPFLEGIAFSVPALTMDSIAQSAGVAEAAVEFRADGALHSVYRKWTYTPDPGDGSGVYVPSLVDSLLAGFASPQPISAEAAALLQVRCKLATGAHLTAYNALRDPANPPLNQWVMLTATRKWRLTGDTEVWGFGTGGMPLVFQVRRRDTMQVVADRSIIFNLQQFDSDAGGGG